MPRWIWEEYIYLISIANLIKTKWYDSLDYIRDIFHNFLSLNGTEYNAFDEFYHDCLQAKILRIVSYK